MKRWLLLLLVLVACGDAGDTTPDCSVCSEHASCVAAPEGVVCQCEAGFTGDGKTCRDVDECTLATATCDEHASCENTVGGYACTCLPGFQGDGTSCDDAGEGCAPGVCPAGLTCVDLAVDHACLCPLGEARRGDACVVSDQLGVNGSPCAIFDDRLFCWGLFHAIGQPPFSDDPVEWASISVGIKHACGLDRAGVAWCAGDDDTGALGRGAQGTERFYMAPDEVVGGHSFGQIRAGGRVTCAIDLDRHLWCWGEPFDGESRSFVPLRVDDAEWQEVSVGVAFACGLHVDGSLWCWGERAYGTPSFGQVELPIVPEQVGHGRWRSLSMGESSACAIAEEDQSLWCWGANTAGEAVPSQTGQVFWPTLVDASRWLMVEVGEFHACGIQDGGSLWCWGYNAWGQLGLGHYDPVAAPTQVVTDLDWVDVSTGSYITCARKADGSVWCTGDNQEGEAGLLKTQELLYPGFLPNFGDGWTRLSAGRTGTCAFNVGIACWGITRRFERVDYHYPKPNYIFLHPKYPHEGGYLATSDGETCTVQFDGRLWCFGAESYPEETTSPAVRSIVDGSYRMADSDVLCLLGEDRQVRCEGAGPFPEVPAGSWEKVSLAPDHGCGIDAGGTLSCWGANQAGQLGDGTFADRALPVPTGGAATWLDVQVSDAGGCALDEQRQLWCWPGAEPLPERLGGEARWLELSVGVAHACAVREDASLFCWGDNQGGQLGTGNKVSRAAPVRIGDLTWRTVAAGATHTCGLDITGVLACWGTGYLGYNEIVTTATLNQVLP